MGLAKVCIWVIGEKGYVVEKQVYPGIITAQDALVWETEEKDSPWYILVGTEERIRYQRDTAAGKVRALDEGYPEVGEDGGRLIYQATIPADSLNARAVNTVVLVYRVSKAVQSVAYARIDPAVRVGVSDTLRIQWECQARK
jgi:hypothetical protein